MIENIKEIFPPKTGMREKQVLQDPGYVGGVKRACCLLHGTLQRCMKYKISYVKRVKRNKNSHNTVDLRHVKGVESPFDLQCRF